MRPYDLKRRDFKQIPSESKSARIAKIRALFTLWLRGRNWIGDGRIRCGRFRHRLRLNVFGH